MAHVTVEWMRCSSALAILLHRSAISAIPNRAKTAIDASGKPAGILALSIDEAGQRMADGYRFLSIGSDIGLLLAGARNVVSQVRQLGKDKQ